MASASTCWAIRLQLVCNSTWLPGAALPWMRRVDCCCSTMLSVYTLGNVTFDSIGTLVSVMASAKHIFLMDK